MHKETESVLQYPCEYNLKIFGKADSNFKSESLAIIKKHLNDLTEDNIKERLSKDSNYLAITINFSAQSQQQLDPIYQELSANKLVLMAL